MKYATLIPTQPRRNALYISVAFLVACMALIIAGCASQPSMLAPTNLQIAMDNAAQLRSQAKQRVLLVKQANQRGSISGEDYQAAQNLYEAARSSFDLWINQLQADLTSGKSVNDTAQYNVLVESASSQAKNFNDYVDHLLQLTSRGDAARNIELFVKAGIDVIKTLQKIDRQVRQQLITDLEALRWQAFDAL